MGRIRVASVELRGLTKRFGRRRGGRRDLSLAIAHGQLVSLLGPSGCGKTTTLRLLAGFMAPERRGRSGSATASCPRPGSAVPPERRNMSMIFQSYALWPHMTVAENVAYGLGQRQEAGPRGDRAPGSVGEILGVTRPRPRWRERYPGEISGGQQQRVALARAMVVEPEILLMDEPLSNLDANLREEMRFEIRRLHDAFRTTTVYVTHDQVEAMTTADLIVVMNEGRIEQAGAPTDIYERPRSEFVARFIGGTNILKGRNAGDSAGRMRRHGAALRPGRDKGAERRGGDRLRCGRTASAVAADASSDAGAPTRRWAGRAAPGLSRRAARLSRGTRRRAAAARDHAGRDRSAGRQRGAPDPAARALPGLGRNNFKGRRK